MTDYHLFAVECLQQNLKLLPSIPMSKLKLSDIEFSLPIPVYPRKSKTKSGSTGPRIMTVILVRKKRGGEPLGYVEIRKVRGKLKATFWSSEAAERLAQALIEHADDRNLRHSEICILHSRDAVGLSARKAPKSEVIIRRYQKGVRPMAKSDRVPDPAQVVKS